MPKLTVKIDPSLCITAANCVGIAPHLFQIGDEGCEVLLDAKGTRQGIEYTFDVSASDIALIEEAVDSCPTRAISVADQEGL